MTTVAKSARRAADELETAAPQIAGLVRGVADRVEDYSRNLETQSAADIYEAASDFTRRQPAVVFGLAALAGFFALRTIKIAQHVRDAGRQLTAREARNFMARERLRQSKVCQRSFQTFWAILPICFEKRSVWRALSFPPIFLRRFVGQFGWG